MAEPDRRTASYEFDGQTHQLPLDHVERARRDPRARPLGDLDGRRARAGPGRDGARAPSAARLSVLARARHRVRARRTRGCRCAIDATNVGTGAVPYGCGAHPYLTAGTPTRGLAGPALRRERTLLRSDERGIPIGAGPWRARTTTSADRGAIGRPGSTTASPISSDTTTASRASSCEIPTATALTLWIDESYRYVMLFTGDPLARRRPAQPRRGADDLPAERVPERRGPGAPGARRVVHRAPGASVRRRARENLPAPW